ncbi:MAG: hypothetical protein R3A48_19155 [Polyangiales bacterium]
MVFLNGDREFRRPVRVDIPGMGCLWLRRGQDLDGDGADEVLVTFPELPLRPEAPSYIVWGDRAGARFEVTRLPGGEQINDRYPIGLTTALDVNGDFRLRMFYVVAQIGLRSSMGRSSDRHHLERRDFVEFQMGMA